MKIIIHAGIHRTGTSSLQRFLHQNRDVLAKHRIAYPGSEIHHQKAAWALKRDPSDRSELDELISPLNENQVTILSAEDFCIHTDVSWLEALASKHDVSAVFYLRRQDHWMMSWYNQHIKWPFDAAKSRMRKDEFLASINDFYWLDFESLLHRWSKVLGKDAIHTAVVEPGQVDDVVADFVVRAGLPAGELAPLEKRDNDSLPIHLLEVTRQLGLFELPAKSRIRLISALRRSLPDKANPALTVFSPTERKTILARFDKPNRKVAREFFGREELFLEPAPAPNDSFYEFPELSNEVLLREWIQPVIHTLVKV